MDLDSTFTIVSLIGAVWVLASMRGNAVVESKRNIDQPDARRWRHDGSQPTAERVGNLPTPVEWPEVKNMLI